MKDTSAKISAELLRPLADAKNAKSMDSASSTIEERQMLASFIDAGLVSGICLRDHVGMPSDFANLTITVAGRDRLAQVEKELERGTSLGYVKHYRPKIIAWFFGILALVLVAWLVKNYIK